MRMHRILAALAVLLVTAAAAQAATGKRAEHWKVWWGQSTISATGATLWSETPTSPDETHSSLVTTSSTWGDQTISFTTTTLDQLREGSAPNPWEVGWVMFHFRDLANYYWFMVKTNGFELGKKQGSDTQIFLHTGALPALTVGDSVKVTVRVRGARIRVWVAGTQVVDYTDPNPLPRGSVGLYEEDSRASFDSLALRA